MTYLPGEAWDLAKAALDKGDIKTAESLLVHMCESDARLMIRRIAEKEGIIKEQGK